MAEPVTAITVVDDVVTSLCCLDPVFVDSIMGSAKNDHPLLAWRMTTSSYQGRAVSLTSCQTLVRVIKYRISCDDLTVLC